MFKLCSNIGIVVEIVIYTLIEDRESHRLICKLEGFYNMLIGTS